MYVHETKRLLGWQASLVGTLGSTLVLARGIFLLFPRTDFGWSRLDNRVHTRTFPVH
jgi:hypothetical protein